MIKPGIRSRVSGRVTRIPTGSGKHVKIHTIVLLKELDAVLLRAAGSPHLFRVTSSNRQSLFPAAA